MRNKKDIMKVIAASLLGDGYIETPKGCINSIFKLKLIEEHKDHLEYIAAYIENLTKIRYVFKNCAGPSIIKGKPVQIKNAITLASNTHPIYTNFKERMYGTGKKCVDPHYLTLIDAEFLAIWYQQDGFLHHSKDCRNPTPDIQLCTDSFSFADCGLLRKSIIEKTGFIFNVHRRKKSDNLFAYRLVLTRKQRALFLDTVYPFIQPSFLYKTNLERQTVEKTEEIVRTDEESSEIDRNDLSPALPE